MIQISRAMTRIVAVVAAVGSFLPVLAQENGGQKERLTFTTVLKNPITPVKNQSRSGTCWDYAALGFFESEVLRKTGRTLDLCEMFVANKNYMDEVVYHVRMHGDSRFSEGGSADDVLAVLREHGICPEEAMPAPGTLVGDTLANFTAFFPELENRVGSIVVKDASGEKASLDISVTVTNTNRPPRITSFPSNLREGVLLPATAFALEDDDEEDRDNLRITLKASNGSWLTAKGKKASFPRAPEDFPVAFQSDGTVVNTISARAYAVDGENAISDTLTFTILLDKVQFRLSELWPSLVEGVTYILGEQVTPPKSGSWLMLATPYATSSSALASALGSDTLWIWQDGCYQPAPESLAPGQGFAVRIDSLRPDTTLTGQRTGAVPILPGWNLIGASAVPPQTTTLYLLLNSTYIRLSSPPDVSPLENWAVWGFSK